MFGSWGTQVPAIFRRHFAEEKAPSCSRLVLGFLAPGVHGFKKAELRCAIPFEGNGNLTDVRRRQFAKPLLKTATTRLRSSAANGDEKHAVLHDGYH